MVFSHYSCPICRKLKEQNDKKIKLDDDIVFGLNNDVKEIIDDVKAGFIFDLKNRLVNRWVSKLKEWEERNFVPKDPEEHKNCDRLCESISFLDGLLAVGESQANSIAQKEKNKLEKRINDEFIKATKIEEK